MKLASIAIMMIISSSASAWWENNTYGNSYGYDNSYPTYIGSNAYIKQNTYNGYNASPYVSYEDFRAAQLKQAKREALIKEIQARQEIAVQKIVAFRTSLEKKLEETQKASFDKQRTAVTEKKESTNI